MRALLPLLLLPFACDDSGGRSGSDAPAPGGEEGEGEPGPADPPAEGGGGEEVAGEGEGEPVDDGPQYDKPAESTPPAAPGLEDPDCPEGWTERGAACLPGDPGEPTPRPQPGPDAIAVGPDDDLAQAVADAPAGATLAITGEHDVNLVIDRSLTLMGAGDDVVLWNDEAEGDDGIEPTVKVLAADGPVRLTGLTLTGAGPGVWVGHSAMGASLEHVVLEELERYAFEDRHKGGQATTLEHVVIRKITPRAGRSTALGLSVWAGARVQADHLVIRGVTGAGVWINHFGTEAAVGLTLRDTVIADIHNAAPDGFREPIRVRNLANIVLERVVVEGFDAVGLLTGRFDGAPARTTIEMTDVAFRDATEGDPEMPRLAIGRGTDLTATRLALTDLPGIALVVGVGDDPEGDTPTATIDGLDLAGPGGIALHQTADVTLRGARIHGVAGMAVRALGDGARPMLLRMEDFEIVDGTALRLPGEGQIPNLSAIDTGGGVLGSRAELTLTRGVIGPTLGQGVALSSGATAQIADLSVVEIAGAGAEWAEGTEVTPLMRANPGVGVVVTQGCVLNGERLSWRSIAGVGLMAVSSEVTLSDVVGLEGAGHPSGVSGAGLFATQAATVRVDRLRLEREKWVALMIHDDAIVILRDTRITDVVPAPCGEIAEGEEGSCVTAGQSHAAGIGAVVRNSGVLDMQRFELSGAALAGVVVAEGGELDFVDGTVTGNAIGLNVLVDEFDYDRIAERVFVFDNDTDVAREALPVPDPAALLPFGGTL